MLKMRTLLQSKKNFLAHFFYFKIIKLFSRVFNIDLAFYMSSWLAARPASIRRKDDSDFRKAFLNRGGNPDILLRKSAELKGVVDSSIFFLKNFQKIKEKIFVSGDALKLQSELNGALILTYHHHFNAILCAFLGDFLKKPIHVIAMDPYQNPLAKKMQWLIDNMYGDSEKLFFGGRYEWVRPNQVNYIAFAIKKMLKEKAAIVSVNDFGDPFGGNSSQACQFLDKKIQAPSGLVSLCFKYKIPIYIAWIEPFKDENKKYKFKLNTKIVEKETAKTVLDFYFSNLEQIVKKNPELWECWAIWNSLPDYTENRYE
jgi:lauroyl/myristoyl acyltransferase